MLHLGLCTYSEKEMHLSSCNFCLKRRLGEPAQFKTRLQFGRPQQLVRTNPRLSFTPKEQGVMGKLSRIVMVVFGARQSHVGAKRCYGSKVTNGGFIKVTISLTELTRECDMITCLSNGRKGREGLPCDSKEFKAASGLYPRNL
jgi:hypothetical protein